MSKQLEHGEHNYKVCQYISKAKTFPDWTITSAFYSAIHFIEFILFPLKENNKEYRNINEYKRIYNSPLHDVRYAAVQKHLKDIFPEYRSLYDASRTARYNNYKAYTHTQSLSFIERLEKIRERAFQKSETTKH